MDGCMDVRMYGCMDRYGWIDGCMDRYGWMDVWMHV